MIVKNYNHYNFLKCDISPLLQIVGESGKLSLFFKCILKYLGLYVTISVIHLQIPEQKKKYKSDVIKILAMINLNEGSVAIPYTILQAFL